jgi:hypothetical protein
VLNNFTGQWAPIAGTGLAVLGSLYLFLAERLKADHEGQKRHASKNCPVPQDDAGSMGPSNQSVVTTDSPDNPHSTFDSGDETAVAIMPVTADPAKKLDLGKRRKVAKALAKFSDYVGTAARERFDDSDFRNGAALGFPEVPGERQRNEMLPMIKKQYTHYSRPGSFTGSVASGIGTQVSSATPRGASPSSPRRPETGISQSERGTSIDLQNPRSPSPIGLPRGRRRRSTLEVPAAVRYGHTPNRLSTSSIATDITIPTGQDSPTIVVSPDLSFPGPMHSPLSNPPASFSPKDQSPVPAAPLSPQRQGTFP